MPHTKEAARRKRRAKALPVLGAAGLSFSLVTGASAATGGANPATPAMVAQQMMDEEQISDISLATFRVFDNESAGTRRPRARQIMVSQGACGADFYYPQNSPAVSGPVYQPSPPLRSRPMRPVRKHKRSEQ